MMVAVTRSKYLVFMFIRWLRKHEESWVIFYVLLAVIIRCPHGGLIVLQDIMFCS